MSISLVSAPVIGFDLVRHPRGRAVAEILLLGLSLEPEDLLRFQPDSADDLGLGQWRAHKLAGTPEITHRPLRSVAQTRRKPEVESSGVDTNVNPARRGTTDSSPKHQDLAQSDVAAANRSAAVTPEQQLSGAIEALLRSMILDLDILEQLIRRDVLGWCTPGSPYPRGETATRRAALVSAPHALAAANALVDALAAEWVEDLEKTDRPFAASLRAPLRAARDRLAPRVPDVGPCALPIMRVLQDLRMLGADGCMRLRGVNTLMGSGVTTWAAAVHETSWAIMTTGRVHAAATAQLLAVQAFAESGLTPTDGAEGIWNMVSGHLHACIVDDVLAEETKAMLAKAWTTALPN